MAVYLDNNATTALDEAVLEAMLPYMGQVTGNPSSVHRFGRLQKDAIEQARESVAQLAGARAEQVVFTSGGTESNNLILNGFSQRRLQQGETVKEETLASISRLQKDKAFITNEIARKEKEYTSVNDRFNKDIARFKLIKPSHVAKEK